MGDVILTPFPPRLCLRRLNAWASPWGARRRTQKSQGRSQGKRVDPDPQRKRDDQAGRRPRTRERAVGVWREGEEGRLENGFCCVSGLRKE